MLETLPPLAFDIEAPAAVNPSHYLQGYTQKEIAELSQRFGKNRYQLEFILATHKRLYLSLGQSKK